MKDRLNIIVFLFISISSFSQENLFGMKDEEILEIENLGSRITNFIKTLDENIETVFLGEKRKAAKRNLGYFQNDLKKYLKIRKQLMDRLDKNNYELNQKAKNTVHKLKIRLKKLIRRLDKISYYVNSKMSSYAQSLVSDVTQSQKEQRKMYLSMLDKLILGQDVDIQQLKKNSSKLYKELQEAYKLITKVRNKL